MKKINLIYTALILFFIGCTSDFEEINTNNNAPEKVTASLLLPNIQRSMVNEVLGTGWGIGNIVIQHTAKIQFVNEDRYLWGEINGIWNTGYARLRDVENMLIIADETKDDGVKGVALIMKSWIFSLITDSYGDVPYNDATKAKAGIYYPKYEEQQNIYQGLLNDLKQANDLLGKASGRLAGDLIYNGDYSKWRKLANALRIRALVRISNKKSPASELASIISNPSANPIFESNNDNAVYNYLANSPDQFPNFSSRIGSFNEFRASKTLLDTLQSLKDPRLQVFFRPTPATESAANKVYIGVPNGMDDVNALTYLGGSQNHSRIGPLWYEEAITPAGLKVAKGVIMTYAELQFLLAEAAQKGWISGTTKTFYENGVKASMAYYGVEMPAGYLALPQVELTSNNTENLNKIGFQKWISFFYQGLEAWFDWRRTGIPTLKPGVSNQNGNKIPVRFIYPIIEQSLNGANRSAAVSRQGTDDINTRIWSIK
jgi:hypothetical protein